MFSKIIISRLLSTRTTSSQSQLAITANSLIEQGSIKLLIQLFKENPDLLNHFIDDNTVLIKLLKQII